MTENGKTSTGATEDGAASTDPNENGEVQSAEVDDLAEALAEQAAEAPELDTDEFDTDELEPDPLELLATENASLQDRLLRTVAEMENLRRRTEREIAEARLYAASSFAVDILSVSDNMDRAMEAVSDEQRETADEITRTLLDGVEMVRRELLNIFEKHGINRVEPLGERFDPHRHQAMFEIPDTETANGTVVQVVQPGFVIGERVLRPAMVGVAKGGPKPDPAAEPDQEEPGDEPA